MESLKQRHTHLLWNNYGIKQNDLENKGDYRTKT